MESCSNCSLFKCHCLSDYNSPLHIIKKSTCVTIPCFWLHPPPQVTHTVPNKHYWPSIQKYSCTNLACNSKNSPCHARSTAMESACVHVWSYNLETGIWTYQGQQEVVYETHKKCGCQECTDITSAEACTSTTPCPNGKNQESFCYWTPSVSVTEEESALESALAPVEDLRVELPTLALFKPGVCRCCEPYSCPANQVFVAERCRCECAVSCLPPKVLNQKSCECECPVGTTMNADGDCVGE